LRLSFWNIGYKLIALNNSIRI